MKTIALVTLALALFSMTACSGDGADSARLTALEAEVKVLKQEAQAREKAFREELAQIRMNLEGIQDLLKIEKKRSAVMDDQENEPQTEEDKLNQELDTKAKSFVSENLDRLLAITKKLLDKMEKELDEQMKQHEEQPAPEGDEI